MRSELRDLLAELRGKLPDPGLLPDAGPAEPVRPNLTERTRLWDLAIKVARELGTEVDANDDGRSPQAPPPPSGPRRRRVDYGPGR